jgi:SAM-dependent methyltransferase
MVAEKGGTVITSAHINDDSRVTDAIKLDCLLTRQPVQIVDDVYDFIADKATDYCINFGRQWNSFREVQLDSASGGQESRDRFFEETGWKPHELSGKLILDAGCGAGRFTAIALEHGAKVVAVDISEAAWACRRSVERFPVESKLIVRADLFDLPLREYAVDLVFSLGVLQHTPDPLGGVACLAKYVKPGGQLAVWIYERKANWLKLMLPRSYIRAATARWSAERKLVLSRGLTLAFFPMGWVLSWLGGLGEKLSYFLPYAARHHRGRGSLRRQWQYSLLDTFDWYGPQYESPQRERDVVETMKKAGLENVKRIPTRGMAIVGIRPADMISRRQRS